MRMGARGILIVVVTCILLSICSSIVNAIDANASVTVREVFSLALDTSSINFGTVYQGEWKEVSGSSGYANAAICFSNTGRPWTLSIKASGPLISGSSIIPVENLKWMSTYAGSKNAPYTNYSAGLVNPPTSGYVNFSTVDNLVFKSDLASIPANNTLPNGVEVQFKYAIFLPNTIKLEPGTYTTTVVYTLTE